MKYAEVEELCEHMAELVGTSIGRVMRIHVWIDGEEMPLLDTILIECSRDSRTRILQIFTDAQRQWSRWLDDEGSYAIDGWYDDREQETLENVSRELVPFVPEMAYAVWEVSTHSRQHYLIGFLLVVHGVVALALNVHLDDISLTHPVDFWQYIDKVLPQTSSMQIVRIAPTDTKAIGPT